MGNCYGSRKDPQPLAFDQTEYSALNNQFHYYCELSSETRDAGGLNQKSFEDIFSENPQFGIKLFKFLDAYSDGQGLIKKQPLFEFLELMVKDGQTSVPAFKNLERFELMSLISLQDSKFLTTKEELAQLQLTYLDTLGVIKDLIKMSQNGKKVASTNERYIRSLIDMLYKSEAGALAWVNLVEFISRQMPGAKQAIQIYFQNKFMGKQQSNSFLVPAINTPSYFITDELYFQLLLSTNSVLKDCCQLSLIYSNVAHQGGFSQMVQAMKDCKLPTLILVQHEETYEQKVKQQCFGALTHLKWYDTQQYFGTKEDCLFGLYPYFKVYRTKKGEQNYCYLDSKKGFGFGGKNAEGFRIWIDKNVENSYCTQTDETYDNGPIVLPYVKKLKISIIEIWAIHHPADEADDHAEVNIDLKDPLLQQPGEVQFPDSNADYYWVKNEPQIEEKPSGYYWEQNHQSE